MATTDDEPSPAPLLTARELALHGPWGHSYGPVDFDIAEGGVTIIAAPVSRGRDALMLTLCGRMHHTKGSVTIMGHENQPAKVFGQSMIALLDQIDEIEQSVRVRDLITEKRRWNSPWYKLIRLATQQDLVDMCAPTFGDIPLPPLEEFVDRLPELQLLLLRLAIANTPPRPLLVVGGIDDMGSDADRARIYERLVHLGEHQTVVVADENARGHIDGVKAIVELPRLTAATTEGDTELELR